MSAHVLPIFLFRPLKLDRNAWGISSGGEKDRSIGDGDGIGSGATKDSVGRGRWNGGSLAFLALYTCATSPRPGGRAGARRCAAAGDGWQWHRVPSLDVASKAGRVAP